MDLNYLYTQHQLSLMRADAASSGSSRACHLEVAAKVGERIRDFQRFIGASAAGGWPQGDHALRCCGTSA